VKTLEQRAVLAQHRVRQGFIEERTATINRIRGVLAEFGQVLPQRASEVRRRSPPVIRALEYGAVIIFWRTPYNAGYARLYVRQV